MAVEPQGGLAVRPGILGDLVALSARRAGDLPAVESEGGVRTYAELDRRSQALASWIDEVVPAGRRLGVVLPNCVEWVEAFVATQRAGVPLVPLHPRVGPRELVHAASEASVGAWITGPDGPSIEDGAPVLRTGDPYETAIADGEGRPLTPRQGVESLVVYTAGSTAQPRGVRLSAMNLIAVTLLNDVLAPMGTSDRVLLFTPLAHRVASTRMIHALTKGACTVLMPRYSPDTFVATLRDGDISVVGAVPTALRDLRRMFDAGEAEPFERPRYLLMSGEPLTLPMATVREMFPRAKVIAFYASTETGPVLWMDEHDLEVRPGVSGQPLPGVEVRLEDLSGENAAHGPRGEVLVRTHDPGAGYVALGYVNPSDGQLVDAEGWVRTGDIAEERPDGYLAIVDRKKEMILSGGMNISPREVEDVLARCAGIDEVAVVGVPDERYGERVVAFAVASAEASGLNEGQVIEFAASQAAGYKKPSQVVFLDALPRGRSGKIDRRALRESFS